MNTTDWYIVATLLTIYLISVPVVLLFFKHFAPKKDRIPVCMCFAPGVNIFVAIVYFVFIRGLAKNFQNLKEWYEKE